MTEKNTSKSAAKPGKNRRKSRELVLKGLYSLLLSESDLRETIRDLSEDEEYERADAGYFKSLLEGVMAELEALDARIGPLLDRPIAELSPIEHAILCISGYELMHDISIPYRVAINEGVELAKLYGGTDGYKYVNGVLDKLAAEARPDEVKQAARPVKNARINKV
jgi:transcription antitermination protein NusB